jgi:hypothetical protein
LEIVNGSGKLPETICLGNVSFPNIQKLKAVSIIVVNRVP